MQLVAESRAVFYFHGTKLHEKVNIHDANMLHATFQHTRCNKIACDFVACNNVSYTMQQCCIVYGGLYTVLHLGILRFKHFEYKKL